MRKPSISVLIAAMNGIKHFFLFSLGLELLNLPTITKLYMQVIDCMCVKGCVFRQEGLIVHKTSVITCLIGLSRESASTTDSLFFTGRLCCMLGKQEAHVDLSGD